MQSILHQQPIQPLGKLGLGAAAARRGYSLALPLAVIAGFQPLAELLGAVAFQRQPNQVGKQRGARSALFGIVIEALAFQVVFPAVGDQRGHIGHGHLDAPNRAISGCIDTWTNMLRMARQRGPDAVIGQPGKRSTVDVKMDVKSVFGDLFRLKSERQKCGKWLYHGGFFW
jgi:hypothetical protein